MALSFALASAPGCQGGDSDATLAKECPTNQVDCGGVCTDTSNDPTHCGTCGITCLPSEVCSAGHCSNTCAPTELQCGSVCTTPASDPGHCGSCDTTCKPDEVCEGGQCLAPCDLPRLRCSNTCTDPLTDGANCGACGHACSANEVCSGGQCVCPQGKQLCGDVCTDLNTDREHCGSCSQACRATEVCSVGKCMCPEGNQLCGDTCANFNTDAQHCGDCNTACSADRKCQSGQCVCAEPGQIACDGACTNVQADASHCGACDTACDSFESCQAGRCVFADDGCSGIPADVELSRVALYQAVEVDLFQDGQPLAPSSRKAQVVQNREALFRGFVQVQAGADPKSLSMRLVVHNGDQEKVLFHRRTISGSSTPESLDSTFNVEVPGDLIGPNTTYRVSLAACDDGPTVESAETTRLPRDGKEATLSATKTGRVNIVFVPIIHEGITPDASDALLEKYADLVLAQYPVEGVDVSKTTPIESGFSGSQPDLGRVLDMTLQPKRVADNAPSNSYYYGLIRPTTRFQDYCPQSCTAGIGYVTGASGRDAADYRASLGIAYGDQLSLDVLPHELGHNHGREHAPCQVPDPDANYPYTSASIGSWGYRQSTMELLSPKQYKDFMGYCSPTWVSDYTFDALATRVARVNTTAQQSPLSVGTPREWWSILTTSGGRVWSHPRTTWEPFDSPIRGFAYDTSLTPIAEVEIGRVDLSDSGGYVLLVPPPLPGWFAVGAVGEEPMKY